jgi:membrane associated rhomboid family serine protease
MGIYDREYYRREGPSYLEAILPSGTVCKWLIGINIVLFILQLLTRPVSEGPFPTGGESAGVVTDLLILDTNAVLHGEVWRLLSYAFVHSPDGFSHILFNMLFLWWFGSDLESLYGSREFLAFYLCSALFGGIAFEVWALAKGGGQTSLCLGASGAVTALLVLCACHFPHRMIYVFLFFPVPIWLFAIFNVAQDAFYFIGPYKTHVAVVVHLAGALFAFAYYKIQFRLAEWFTFAAWWDRWKSRRRRVPRSSRLRVYQPEAGEADDEAVTIPAATDAKVDEHFEAKLDAVLEKIARTGRDSLTETERAILQRASDHYKRRRS